MQPDGQRPVVEIASPPVEWTVATAVGLLHKRLLPGLSRPDNHDNHPAQHPLSGLRIAILTAVIEGNGPLIVRVNCLVISVNVVGHCGRYEGWSSRDAPFSRPSWDAAKRKRFRAEGSATIAKRRAVHLTFITVCVMPGSGRAVGNGDAVMTIDKPLPCALSYKVSAFDTGYAATVHQRHARALRDCGQQAHRCPSVFH